MAVRKVEIPHIGAVKLYKRKGARSIRLSVTSAGSVRVSLPHWLPYDAGTKFAISKQTWILAQLAQQQSPLLAHGQAVGKSHHVYFVGTTQAKQVTTRVDQTIIRVTHPSSVLPSAPDVQRAAETACIRALRSQAEMLLPQRLQTLADKHGLPYRSIGVKRLTGRWGSCDADNNIVLNLFLMQLPWHLIDYVLIHELIHTKVLHHNADFWQLFEAHAPNARALRREIRNYRPAVIGQ